jgi:hypothetical protein
MRWCFVLPGKPLPESFEVPKGSSRTLVELERYVVDVDAIVSKLQEAGATVYKDDDGNVSELVLPRNFDSVDAIKALKDLRQIPSIVSYVMNDELVDSLVGRPALRSLRLHCEVPADVIGKLTSGLPNLKTFGMFCRELTESRVEQINKWNSLTVLKIGGNQDDLAGLEAFSESKISSLQLSNCKFGKSGMERIARHLKLRSLSLLDCKVSDKGLGPVSRLENLYALCLKNSAITDEQIQSIKALPQLHILDISGTRVTNQTLEYIRANMPEVFSVDATHVAFDRGILEIVNSVEPGRQFDVTVSKTSVTREEVEKFGLANGRVSVVEY